MSQMSAGPGVLGEQLPADAEELMAEHTPEGQQLEHNLQILEEACSGDYDLVVIGAHPDEGWRRIPLDDLAHRLLVRLNRPVLVVR